VTLLKIFEFIPKSICFLIVILHFQPTIYLFILDKMVMSFKKVHRFSIIFET